MSLTGDAGTDQVRYRTGWGKHISVKAQEGALSVSQCRSRPVLLAGECEEGQSSHDREVLTLRMGTILLSKGSLWQ